MERPTTAGPSPQLSVKLSDRKHERVPHSRSSSTYPAQTVFERIPSLFRFPDNRSSASRDDTLNTPFHVATPPRQLFSPPRVGAASTADIYTDLDLRVRVENLEAENEALRRRLNDTATVSSRHVDQLTASLAQAERDRDAAQVALVQEKERNFLLQRRVAFLEAIQWPAAHASTATTTTARQSSDIGAARPKDRREHASATHTTSTSSPVSYPQFPAPDGDDDYILSSLRPAARQQQHTGVDSHRAPYDHPDLQDHRDPYRLSFRLRHATPEPRVERGVQPNPTVSTFSQPHRSAPDESTRQLSALASTSSLPDVEELTHAHLSSAPREPRRSRSQRFRSPLFAALASARKPEALHLEE